MSPGERTGCPLCGADEPRPLFQARDPDRPDEGPFLVARCRVCALVHLSPQPTHREDVVAYGPEFFSGPTPAARIPFQLAQQLLLMERVRLMERWVRDGRILDVGCGDGAFLARMGQRGFRGHGVEASDVAAAAARSRGLRVDVGDLAEIHLEPRSYDAVTLWHVLEHLPDPGRALATCRELLSPAGVLVLSVPNFAGLQARLLGRHWFHLDVPRHRIHFEPQTLKQLLSQSGYSIVHSTQISFEYNPYGLLQSVMNLVVRPNHLYRLLRRSVSPGSAPLATAASMILAPAMAPSALVASTIAAVAGYGATLTVVARRDVG